MTNALVLGAGGTVGIAYHAGVLRALEQVGGFRPDDADLIVGTSAGSMIGAALRSGISTEDLWAIALGEHPTMHIEQPDQNPWSAAWSGPTDAIRRVVGSAYVLQRSLIRVPTPSLPSDIRRWFPGGFFTIADDDGALDDLLPKEWPTKPLWLVTVDIKTGRRVVLGRRNPVRTDLHTAVKASCAIPAFFQPQRVGRHTLVDGGVHSTTNLDLTSKIAPDVIIGVVPMGFDPASPPAGVDLLIRRFAQGRLAREVASARGKGAQVLLLRPTHDDLGAMGGNLMRRGGNDIVTRVAYDSAARVLETERAQGILARLRETIPA